MPLAAEGGISLESKEIAEDNKKELKKKEKPVAPSKNSRREKEKQPRLGSPGPTRANSSRSGVSSVIGSSPFSWRKSKPEKKEKVSKFKPVSKAKSQQMVSPKPPKPTPKRTPSTSFGRGNISTSAPQTNNDFAAQLAATLKARQT